MSWAHITPEARARALQRLRAQWADPEYRARHTERLRAQARTAKMGGKRNRARLESDMRALGIADPAAVLDQLCLRGWRIVRETESALMQRKTPWTRERDAEGLPA